MRQRSLRASLVRAVIWALLPVLALALAHGLLKLSRDAREAQQLLRQIALSTASEERNVIAGAEHLLRSLALQSEVQSGGEVCQRVLSDAIAGLPYYANIARLDRNGQTLCAALPGEAGRDAAGSAWWQDFTKAGAPPGFALTEKLYGKDTGTWVVIAALPLFDSTGYFDGAMTVSIDVAWLDYLVQSQRLPGDSVVALLDRSYRIIASTNDEVARAVLAAAAAARGDVNLPSATGPQGETWTYAIAPLVRQDIYVAFAMRKADLFGWRYVDFGLYLGLPLATIALSCLALWASSQRLVLRWITVLRRIARAYGRGHYAARANLTQAPEELQQLGESFFTMGEAIRERDRKLREALDYKAAAIREIHHRVKNNLQIVMSLLTLQANRLGGGPERAALEQARARVNALALVHNILHNVEDMELVDTQRLLPALARQLHDGMTGSDSGVDLAIEVAPLQLASEQATPLALFLVEALTNVYKHAFPDRPSDGQPIRIKVSLTPLDAQRLRLAVEDNGIGSEAGGESPGSESPGSENRGTGARLMAAFAQQLGGETAVHTRPGEGTTVSLIFPLASRHRPPEPPPG